LTFSTLTWDTTSGRPDDSREADERGVERRLPDLRGRVKAARAALSAAPGAAESMRADWKRERAFYAKFGVSALRFRNGLPSVDGGPAAMDGDLLDVDAV
jgi:hypothetical protein